MREPTARPARRSPRRLRAARRRVLPPVGQGPARHGAETHQVVTVQQRLGLDIDVAEVPYPPSQICPTGPGPALRPRPSGSPAPTRRGRGSTARPGTSSIGPGTSPNRAAGRDARAGTRYGVICLLLSLRVSHLSMAKSSGKPTKNAARASGKSTFLRNRASTATACLAGSPAKPGKIASARPVSISMAAPPERFGWTRMPSSSAAIRSPLMRDDLRRVAADGGVRLRARWRKPSRVENRTARSIRR